MDWRREPRSGKIVLHLDRLMVERGISLGELAGKVGITNANLSKIKNNHITAMRFSTLIALCEALHCQVGELMEYRPVRPSVGRPVFKNKHKNH